MIHSATATGLLPTKHTMFLPDGTPLYDPRLSTALPILSNGHAGLGVNPSAPGFDSSKNEVSIESLEARLARAAASGINAFVLMADMGGQFAHANATGAGRIE